MAGLGVGPGAVLVDAVAHLLNGAFEALGAWSAAHPEIAADDLAVLCARVVHPGLVATFAEPPPGW